MSPDFTLPPITEGPNGQMVVNWSYRDLALPFSEGGPSRSEWESLKARGLIPSDEHAAARRIVRQMLAASVKATAP